MNLFVRLNAYLRVKCIYIFPMILNARNSLSCFIEEGEGRWGLAGEARSVETEGVGDRVREGRTEQGREVGVGWFDWA